MLRPGWRLSSRAKRNRRSGIEAVDLARNLSRFAIEKKARKPRLLDVGDLTSYTSFLLILSATSERHARALADHLREQSRALKVRPLGIEGFDHGQWILLDYGEVVVHIFMETTREYYDLDGLWVDASSLPIEEAG